MKPTSIRLSPALLLALILTLVALPAAAQLVVTEKAPRVAIEGLEAPVRVIYDENAVPHIRTGNDHDAIFMQGYLHARDRFFQMDNSRHLFSGTLSELLGEAALPSDLQLRALGLRRAAEASLEAYPPAAVRFLEAYADGVNAYLNRNPLPPEYGLLELSHASVPEWTVIDSLVVAKGLAFGLSFDLFELTYTPALLAYSQVGGLAGFNGAALFFEDIFRVAPFDPSVSIPKAAAPKSTVPRPPLKMPDARVLSMLEDLRDRVKAVELPAFGRNLLERKNAGSNWWLVSGERSTSGHAMLANDPHLALDIPSTFYEIHLFSRPSQGRVLNANGVSFPGAPGLVQGCTKVICWGSTVNPMDVTDVYLEELVLDPTTGFPTHTIFDGQPEPLVVIPQAYLVNVVGDGTFDNRVDSGLGPLEGGITLVVPRRNNGPILALDFSSLPATGISVQYTGFGPTTELETFRRWLRARTREEFVEALQYFDVGSQNWGYASVSGDIAYYTSAELPIREDLQTLGFPDGGMPPFLVRDGTHQLKHEWMAVENPQPQQALNYEVLPFSEMPQVVNPASGYIANANNDPVGNTLDNNVLNEVRPGGGVFYLSPNYASLRMGQVTRQLQAKLAAGPVSAEDLKEIQSNNQLLDAEYIAPFITAAFDNASAVGAPASLMALAADPGVAEAVGRLRAWDYSTPTGMAAGYDPGDDPENLTAPSAEEVANSVATTIFSVWRGLVVQQVIDGALINRGLGDFLPPSALAYTAFANLLLNFETNQGVGASGIDFFALPGGGVVMTPAESRDLVLLSALRQALDELAGDTYEAAFGGSTNQNDYRWGYLHRIVFDHPLGDPALSVPSNGGFSSVSPQLPGIARPGGYQVIDASSHSARADGVNDFMFGSGPARRFVGVLSPQGIKGEQIIPGGQSGVPGSFDYANMLGRWLTNQHHTLLITAPDVQEALTDQQVFLPRE